MTNAIRGPILNPLANGHVDFVPDGLIVPDAAGDRVHFVGPFDAARHADVAHRAADGLILPPLYDCHTHVPQHPIRGRFLDGVADDAPRGRLLAGLERNVFPAEARSDDEAVAAGVARQFLADTLANGVVGGAAYATVSPAAARAALRVLPETWAVGLVLMNQNCPAYLRTNEATLDADVAALAAEFGGRLIVTDRFAVAVSSALRRRGVSLSERHGLRMQTHLNEQLAEKAFVERELYPHAGTYTNVYAQDGLLGRSPILAHCVRMSGEEFDQVAAAGAFVAHCPTSNALLGSGVMPLDDVLSRGVPFAICTDVGASPTTSLLAEMAQFLRVHDGRSARATPSLALFAVTLGAEAVLMRPRRAASFEAGGPFAFVEVKALAPLRSQATADEVIREALLGMTVAAQGLSDAYDELRRSGLTGGDMMRAVEADVAETVRRLEHRVARVTPGEAGSPVPI